jgi:hypothetical protein
LSDVTPIPFGFTFSSIVTIASPRPFVTTDGRDINLDNITGDDYPGGTVSTSGARVTAPANAWRNWYRTVDLRLARSIFNSNGKKVSLMVEAFNIFNWNNNLTYGSTQFSPTGVPVATFGIPTGAYGARQGQVGMRVDW